MVDSTTTEADPTTPSADTTPRTQQQGDWLPRRESCNCSHLPCISPRDTNIQRQMHKWLQREIPDWSAEKWTSGLRAEHNEYPPFLPNERDYTDFTYRDHSGAMVRFLQRAGVPILPSWSETTTFHLEVKTTPGGWEVPFFVSRYQLEKVGLERWYLLPHGNK